MRKALTILTLTFLLTGIVIAQREWEQLAKTKETIYLYKPTQVRRVGNGVKFWVKYLPASEKARSAAIKHYSELFEDSHTDFSNYGYTLVFWEFNCSEMKSRILSIANYETNGKVIANKDLKDRDWDNVVPDSLGEHFADVVCK